MRVFAFVDHQKATFAVRTLCRVCAVSTSGYYAWAAREAAGPTPAQLAEDDLVTKIRLAHDGSRRNYGEPASPASWPVTAGRSTTCGSPGSRPRPGSPARVGSVRSAPPSRTPAPRPSPTWSSGTSRVGLDQLWFGDLTCVATDEGWLYLSGISDACSRRLLGWSISDHMRVDGPLDALHAAVECRGGTVAGTGVVFHSDKGCPVHRRRLHGGLRRLRGTQSMGSVIRQRTGGNGLGGLQARGHRLRALRHQGAGPSGDLLLDRLVQLDPAAHLDRETAADRVRTTPPEACPGRMKRIWFPSSEGNQIRGSPIIHRGFICVRSVGGGSVASPGCLRALWPQWWPTPCRPPPTSAPPTERRGDSGPPRHRQGLGGRIWKATTSTWLNLAH